MKEAVLTTAALTKQYPAGNAVDHVDMRIEKGDIYGFIGQNGAGKTTLIRMVGSLIHKTSGEISLFGRSDEQGLAVARKRMGCVAENPAFFAKLTARENLEYYRIQRGIPDQTVVERSLETVGLADTGKKKYQAFSLGMKQRLGLALAIMGNPDFLVLDEPINGLDPTGIIEFRNIVKELNQAHGMTFLISSHILAELSQIATKFGIIHHGKLIREFTQEQLEEETRQYLVIKVDDGGKAAAVLQEQLHTEEFEVYPDHVIRIYDFLDNPSEVTYQLSVNGVRVISANSQGVNLEDYFLNATGGEPERRAL